MSDLKDHLQPIIKTNIPKMIQNQIIKMIRDGSFKPGKRLPSERELCDEFRVSRTSVREAIEGLVTSGIVEKRGDGAYVSGNLNMILSKPFSLMVELNGATIDDIYEARIATECQNVRIAAKKATAEDLETLKSILDKTDTSSSLAEVRLHSADFHRKIAEMTHNPVLIAMFSVIYNIISKNPRNKYTEVDEHREIFEKIKRGDADSAEEEMLKHLLLVRKNCSPI